MFTHFYSDPHLGHNNIIRFSERPFVDVADMNQGLIDRYNAIVGPHDYVLWVGDVSMKLSVNATRALLDKFNGKRGLVMGNHDGNHARALRLGFSFVADELFLKIHERVCRVKHYPYALDAKVKKKLVAAGEYFDDRYEDRRPPRVPGEVLIHGHTHSAKRRDGNQIHVGVDAWDYAPVRFEEVLALVKEV